MVLVSRSYGDGDASNAMEYAKGKSLFFLLTNPISSVGKGP